MARTVTVGLDASPESRAAAEWAAREAALRGLPLKVVHVWEPVPEPVALAPPPGGGPRRQWTEEAPRQAAEGLRLRHPGVEVSTDRFTGNPAQALTEAADGAELMVLGSRGLGGIAGFMAGSVGLAVLAHAERPVVLVRAGEQAADEHKPDPAGIPSAATPFRPVVLGLDLATPDERLLGFAFDAAARRGASLRVVHGWSRPRASFPRFSGAGGLPDELAHAQARALTEVLRAWRRTFPDVEVIEASRCGGAAQVLLAASREACLVVVGRRVRTSPLGAHIGHVTHAVLHHVVAPVAVVPHD
ncbi:stress-inducible protein [Streptomyces incarnatus]|uniref:Stress-inducible protein n=1 Tax=Streptomyces incarnatus TaxID=665007 RepID=A0ABM5TW76_9ACTN|nr:universal stress protein [Streptomyces incarnatus]AKJ15358.1 stress-inducible protein [Streptomyces incarnatus]